MTTTPNEGPSHRSWMSDRAEPAPAPLRPEAPARRPAGFSGRQFVIGSLLAIATFWILGVAVLRPSLVGYKHRSEFGRREVAPAVLGMLKVRPAGVDPEAWEDAVRATHALLATTTDAGTMTLEEMTALRDRARGVANRAEQAPDAAPAELAALWDDVAAVARKNPRRGEPEVDKRHPRPAVLPPPKG